MGTERATESGWWLRMTETRDLEPLVFWFGEELGLGIRDFGEPWGEEQTP